MTSETRHLLSIVELGGYPDFSPIYQRCGYSVETVRQMRKAMSRMKKLRPGVIVAEFNFQSDFRDRTSSLESLLATVQQQKLDANVIVFYEKEFAPQFQRLKAVYPDIHAMSFPINEDALEQTIQELSA